MKELDFNNMNSPDSSDSSQFAPLRIFQHGKLFEELGMQRLWDQKKLINKLNHVNFTDGYVFILINNDETGDQIII